MAHDVFLSYSSKDKPAADATCAKLESRSIRCWMAPRDIEPGSDWSASIIDGINGSRAMVLVFSANANASQQIKREVERAVHKGIPIIPLRIENVVPERSLEYFISTPHWLDAYTEPLDRHLDYLADVLRHILDGKAVPEPPPPPLPPWWRGPLGIAAAAGALVVLLAIAWFAWLRPPPGFVGSWTASALDARQFTVDNGMAAAEVPAQLLAAALRAHDAQGKLIIDATGQYTLAIDGRDEGTIRVSPPSFKSQGNALTFTSDVTHAQLQVGLLLTNNGTGYNPDYDAAPDGRTAWNMLLMPAGQQSGAPAGDFMGTPNAPGASGLNTLRLIATTWKPQHFTTPVPGLGDSDSDNHVTADLAITPSGRYTFSYQLREKGVWHAADGTWSRQIPSAGGGYSPPSTDGGPYTFSGRDTVTLLDSFGSSVWQRS